MGKRWCFHPHDATKISALERTVGLSPILAQLLLCRGIQEPAAIRRFLDAKLGDLQDPELLPGLSKAADHVHQAIGRGDRITVYGDYDADGMTGTAILVRCLTMLGADVGYYVPNRMQEGYGLNDEALQRLSSHGTQLVITVDCGIASVQQAKTAAELGLELVITDHHEMLEELPQAAAIVHPRLPGSSYPFGELCGAGVAFKLAWGLCCRASDSKKVSPAMREFLMAAIGICSIGTVADVVPLQEENRVLVRHGLLSLKERPVTGLAELIEVSGMSEKPAFESEDIGFGIAPRLNAAGRLGQAQLGVELLTSDSTSRCKQLAEYIHQLNNSRESLERAVYLAANKQIKEQFDADGDPAFVLAGTGWHAGVIGIVAGRLAEKYHRPVVLISVDELKTKAGLGSGRSACGLNLHQAFHACDEFLVSCGGHAAAAGLKIEEPCIESFRAAFCEFAAGSIQEDDLVARVHIDAEAPLSQLTLQTVQQIEKLAPFGAANPRPVLCASRVSLAEPPKRMGGGERHLSVKLSQHGKTMRAVAFGKGDWCEELAALDQPIDVAYRPVINQFRGRKSVEAHLVDWRKSTVPDPAAVPADAVQG